jgi:hypothetical protein
MVDRLSPMIAELTQAVEQEAEEYPAAQRLATHPGVGALMALAFVLIIGQAERFRCGNQVASYLGLVPAEDSSGERQIWDISVNKATLCCAFCWWKQLKLRSGAMYSGGASIFIWRCGDDEKSPRSRWPVASRFVCTGGGATNGITSNGNGLVRKRASSEQALVMP